MDDQKPDVERKIPGVWLLRSSSLHRLAAVCPDAFVVYYEKPEAAG